ncbi:MAG: hypothetical protein LBK40_06155 [Spirochaetaceae bacterium]|jgi:hypothetical protein|nr:hypothetical protein [Spirochaetaceae bacterium]
MGDQIQAQPPGGASFEAVWAALQKTDRIIEKNAKEAKRRLEETDRIIEKNAKEAKRRLEETDRIITKNAERAEKMDRRLDKMMDRTDKQIGALGNRFGELAEHLVTPNIAEKFRALGYAFTRAGPNVEFFDAQGKALAEVDVWLENGEFAMAVEVKSYLCVEDVKEHLKRMDVLRRYADARQDRRKLLGAAAGAIMRKNVRAYAEKNGLYVIEQSGDTVTINIPEGFQPRIW